jgi:hypothetical protein
LLRLTLLVLLLDGVTATLLEVFVISNRRSACATEKTSDGSTTSRIAVAHIVSDNATKKCSTGSSNGCITLQVVLRGTVAQGES